VGDMINDGEYFGSLDSVGCVGMVRRQGGALVAGAFPVKPPMEWFRKPHLSGLTALTIEDTGRVFGHIASWKQSHIGLAGSIKPPRSRSRYAFFQTGQVKTNEGDLVNVGQITLTGGHAPLSASVADTVAHYDNTRSAVMDVSVFEDKHGIGVCGSLRPGVTEEQLREIRASGVSGDWRPINGALELVAICAVNVPGFPIPRARVASGATIALVAAGIEPLVELAMVKQKSGLRAGGAEGYQQRRAVRALHTRVERLEAQLSGKALENRSILDEAIVAAAGRPSVDVDALRNRVHTRPMVASADELRARVHGGVTAAAPDPVAELRRRVHK
jgi:hypothetical protein